MPEQQLWILFKKYIYIHINTTQLQQKEARIHYDFSQCIRPESIVIFNKQNLNLKVGHN